jgi:hypothetical protein
MIHRIFAPFQDSKATVVVAGISIVVWEAVADVCDILLGLSFVKVASEHMFEVVEVFS